MSLTERAAYLRGLYDGMELGDAPSKEAKLLSAIIDVVQELSAHVTENEASLSALADQVDELSEITDDLQEIMDEECSEDDFDDDDFSDDDFEDEYFSDEEEESDGDGFETSFEVECPNCQRMLTVGEAELSTGTIQCETCGQKFQIELEFDDDGELIEE